MARSYRTRMSKRIIMRSPNGRFRKTTIQDLGIPQAAMQEGPAICINCGHGADAWWHPVMKEGFCPKCKSTKKISVNLLPQSGQKDEMKPLQVAKQWALAQAEYSGLLTVTAQTGRGKGGRLGTKKTEYSYVVSKGKASRSIYSHRSGVGNGICDVTGRVHHKRELAYYHIAHPRRGEKPYTDNDITYWNGWLYTSQKVADEIGATIGQFDDKTSYDGCYNEQHPIHRKQELAWESRIQIAAGQAKAAKDEPIKS